MDKKTFDKFSWYLFCGAFLCGCLGAIVVYLVYVYVPQKSFSQFLTSRRIVLIVSMVVCTIASNRLLKKADVSRKELVK